MLGSDFLCQLADNVMDLLPIFYELYPTNSSIIIKKFYLITYGLKGMEHGWDPKHPSEQGSILGGGG